jgi:hypothetical protein
VDAFSCWGGSEGASFGVRKLRERLIHTIVVGGKHGKHWRYRVRLHGWDGIGLVLVRAQ